MSPSPLLARRTFLTDQRLSLLDPGHDPLPLLDVAAARELRDRGGFQEPGRDSPWKALPRPDWLARSTPGGDLRRTIVIADAGLGKTTNLRWFEAVLPRACPSQLAFFLSIDRLPDDPEAVFDVLIRECWRCAPGCDPPGLSRDRAVRTLRARRDAGQLTLAFDSLDQALSRPASVETLRLLLTRSDWRACPVVVSTRPHALTTEWDRLFAAHAKDWRFVRVEQLDEGQQRFLLGTVADEADPTGQARIDRYELIPADGRTILGVPRVVDLLRNLGRYRRDYEGLRTLADVYWRCTGEMLLEGLRAHHAGSTLGRGGRPGPVPATFRAVQRDIARNILGAAAFEMFVNADAAGSGSPRPNLSHVDEGESEAFLTRMYARLVAAAGVHRAAGRVAEAERLGALSELDFQENFNAVAAMNAGPLENYLLDGLGRHRDIRWRNPTVQAFFAAAWVCRHGTPDDVVRLQGWVVDPHDERFEDYREFWRLASELDGTARTDPTAVRREAWVGVMSPLYDGTARDPQGRPVRSCEFIYRSWDGMAGTTVQELFLAEFPRITDSADSEPEKRRVAEAMLGGFVDLVRGVLPGDTGHFMMGALPSEIRFFPRIAPPDEDPEWAGRSNLQHNPPHPVTLTHYRLHRFGVTNAEYELFDPRHRDRRWGGEPHPAVQESGDLAADDRCPAVCVSWYNAWCFATWLGGVRHASVDYTITLPTEAQWEYAFRAGAGPDQPFSFGPGHGGTTRSADVCNFNGNAPRGEEAVELEWRRRTIPVDALHDHANDWSFVRLHSNLWEWCEDWLSLRFYHPVLTPVTDPFITVVAPQRVLRGGSWTNSGGHDRSANRDGSGPANRYALCGFRLAATPAGRTSHRKRSAPDPTPAAGE
jgi:formylglycine-generating enzyme required for sulfatase activity